MKVKVAAKGRKNQSAGIGCGYLLKLSIVTSVLMILNSYVVGKIVEANLSNIPDLFHDVRLFQFCQIFFPFLLVLVQFWIYDRYKDYRIAQQSVKESQTKLNE